MPLTVPSQIVNRVIDGECVLVDPRRGRFAVLNATGSKVWDYLSAGGSSDALCKATNSVVSEFLTELEQDGWLESLSEGSSSSDITLPLDLSTPKIISKETLTAVAGICDSGHSGGMFCRNAFPCIQLFA